MIGLRRIGWLLALCSGGLVGEPSVAAEPPAAIPALTLLRPFALSHVKLSPSGRYVAGIAATGPLSATEALVCLDLETRKKQVVAKGELLDFAWASDERLVILGDGTFFGGMLAVNRDGQQSKVLHEAMLSQAWRNRGSWSLHEFLPDGGRNYPDILVKRTEGDAWQRAKLPKPSVYRLNVLDGRFTLVAKNPGRVTGWLADREGRVRLATEIDGLVLRVLYRASAQEPWQAVIESRTLRDAVDPVAFHSDGARFYVKARRDQDTVGLYLFDPRDRSYGECLWRHEKFDAAGVIDLNGALGVFYDGERPQLDWLDGRAGTLFRSFDEALPGVAKLPVGASPDGARLLVFTFSDRDPGTYYVFDRARKALDFMGDAAPWLKTNRLAEMKPIMYPASDGLQIPGYLTLPPGRDPRNLPLVVMPHGGPWVRVSWAFDPEVQFLANRGYAVLQPNYRGSTGYGFAFEQAGYRQFGLRIQDDITDAVRWAIDQGLADPRRVAISGASFGGYATLMGLIQTPELYRCGINCYGVSDWVRHLRTKSDRWPRLAQDFMRTAAGDYRADEDFLEQVSPLKRIAELQAPLLLAYGGRDGVVDIEQGRLLEKELKKHHKTFELVYEPFEGHGFRRLRHAAPLYERMDMFLKKYMP